MKQWTISKDGETVEKEVSHIVHVSVQAKRLVKQNAHEFCHFPVFVTLLKFKVSRILR